MLKSIIGVYIMISIGICNTATNEIIKKKIEKAIIENCKHFSYGNISIEPALVKAIIKEESGFKPYSLRVEPHLKRSKWYLDLLTEQEQKNDTNFMSAGLMQELYGIAKADGYVGSVEDLMNINTSLAWGIKRLRKIIKWEWALQRVISAWNQGLVTKKKNGSKVYVYKQKFVDANKNGIKDWWEDWKNEAYVKRVYKYYRKFGGKIKIRKYNG